MKFDKSLKTGGFQSLHFGQTFHTMKSGFAQ